MSSSKAFGQYLELDSKSTTMLPSDALSQSPKSDTAIDTTPSSNVSIIKQLQSDLAEIDGQLKGFATHEEPPNEALIQAKAALTQAKASMTQAKADKRGKLIAVMMKQLQSDISEIDKQLKDVAVRGEPPNKTLIEAKAGKEKELIAVMIKQLQSDIAEIDRQLKGIAARGEPPNEALIQAKAGKEKELIAIMIKQLQSDIAEIAKQLKMIAAWGPHLNETLIQKKAAFTKAKADKEKELVAVLIMQLQYDVVEVNKQLHAFSVRGERPDNAVIQAKVNKEKHLYKLKQKKELQEGREVSMEHTINATKALVGYLPTPDELVSRATIKRRNGRAYAKNEVFVYQTYRYDAYLEPPHKEAKYRHVKDEHFTVPYPIDLPHYFPQEGHELTEVDRQKFDSEHKAEGSWLGFEDFDPHGYLEQAGGLDTLSLVAAKG